MKKFWNIEKTVSREEILWCYRTLLEREPESEAAIRSNAGHHTFKALVQSVIASPEYKAKVARRTIRPKDAAGSQDVPPLISATLNEALATAEFEAGVFRVNSTPKMLTLETSSRCNLRCVMCPQAINAVDRPKHMEPQLMADLERFIRQADNIQLHGIGEPLASPAFWDSLNYIPEGCASSINTNFTVLDDKRLAKLVASQLRFINVSLDAARPETYQKIRGFSFDEVLGNIRRFVAARAQAGKQFPQLYMNMTLMRSNIEEILDFIELAASIGAKGIYFWHLNRWTEAEMAAYVIDRDGWVFDYKKEGLWNFPALSNKYLRAAESLAREKAIDLCLDQNKQVYFDELETA